MEETAQKIAEKMLAEIAEATPMQRAELVRTFGDFVRSLDAVRNCGGFAQLGKAFAAMRNRGRRHRGTCVRVVGINDNI